MPVNRDMLEHDDSRPPRRWTFVRDPSMPLPRGIDELDGVEIVEPEVALARGVWARTSMARVIADASTTVDRIRVAAGSPLAATLDMLTDKYAVRRSAAGLEGMIDPAALTLSPTQLRELDSLARARAAIGAPEQAGLVLKPIRGSSSRLVFVCHDDHSWQHALREHARASEPSGHDSSSELLVEEYVEGEELAVDLYFDDDGEPVLLGIHVHPFADPLDVRDTAYRTDASTVRRWLGPLAEHLRRCNARWQLRSFPAHVELRARPDGRVFLIEINPLRFGLLTGELSLLGFGLNPYAAFFQARRPDWPRLLDSDDARATGLVVGHVPGAGADDHVDLDKLRATLQQRGLGVARVFPMPVAERPYVCGAYVQGSVEQIDAFLHFDFSTLLGART